MKTTKLLALLLAAVLALSACQKTALRNDFFEYSVFMDGFFDLQNSNGGQLNGLMLGVLRPFDYNKERLLDITAGEIEYLRTFETNNDRVRELHEIKVNEWLLYHAAFEKLDETMLVANHRTWEDVTSQDMEVYRQDLLNVFEKIDSLVDGGVSVLDKEYNEKSSALADETGLYDSRKWKKHSKDTPA